MSRRMIGVARIAGLTILGMAGLAVTLYGLAWLSVSLTWDDADGGYWKVGLAITALGIGVLTAAIYFRFRGSSRRETWRDWHPRD